MLNQVYATKKAMTQAFSEGKRIPLTVLTVVPHVVIAHKTVEKDGYSAVILSVRPKKIKEVLSHDVLESKTEINLSEILIPGSTVSVMASSKGKGTSGVMKRWGMHGGPRTHGQSDRQRAPGSIGRGTTPGRVLPGKHMAGRMGNTNTSVKNLKIHSFDPATGILEITGCISGGRGALALITITKKYGY
ncbi:MAG: 50S ribosomal protein L3 [Candidatus Collierbacteria bacterium GW2011_GWB2_45_17]|uniref:Large ribosomal subunit protein uL3 n=2 Tax=Candidatus Collieribacteriota TaxID=1752725 RepID=A0A837IK05_9BACT|nr:MAG: 50S ribosomal protein L3 [Microgenomates group bacterium GW2011_GWC1_44_23]KKT96166.1 MAG: 50S ribosomal protein L3 [Candidatus Collierbacteria bacterium GW2011_GWA1_45_15]KKU01206.1 MAG: 50S ribosomal protein L3 [Candidatus Collierbacteria bacterium GW2011_GWB2_45_17]KKU08514.1 MAG: 50S ribosomal protein L3 [Candidatus Collierbacteria bacterium GW2011_GWC2_45_40]HBC44910.1 50S ribosomal protein L3 [Candidatus Collierbacteria bacterium]